MERKIGEIFSFNDGDKEVRLKVCEDKGYSQNKCYFECCGTCLDDSVHDVIGECSCRSDGKAIHFELVDECSSVNEVSYSSDIRHLSLTIEKARDWFKQGGELRMAALQVFDEDELVEPSDNRPHSWEEFCEKGEHEGYFVNQYSDIEFEKLLDSEKDRNIYPTKELAEASLALAQLLQLRQEWVGDWVPEYSFAKPSKFYITYFSGELNVWNSYEESRVMLFPTKEMALEFLKDFRNLLEIAKPLL